MLRRYVVDVDVPVTDPLFPEELKRAIEWGLADEMARRDFEVSAREHHFQPDGSVVWIP